VKKRPNGCTRIMPEFLKRIIDIALSRETQFAIWRVLTS
jgi:hypothetical protein